jgi:hypothetical protein
MTAATSKRAPAVEPEPGSQIMVPRVSKIAGFRIDPGEYRFDEADRAASATLASLLNSALLGVIHVVVGAGAVGG